jgi:hypothetical protein
MDAKCYWDKEGVVADFLILTLDEEAVKRLKELAAKAKAFGKSFGSDWAVNTVDFCTHEALPTAIVAWYKFAWDSDWWENVPQHIKAAMTKNDWANADELSLPSEHETQRTELDYIKIWPRTGAVRFTAMPKGTDYPMWAGDFYVTELEA